MKDRSLNWLAPIFLSLVPTLAIFLHNQDQIGLYRLGIPLMYAASFAAVSFLASLGIFRHTEKASIWSSVWVIAFFGYGYLYLLLGDTQLPQVLPVSLNVFLLTGYTLILGCLGYWLWKTPLRKKPLQEIASVFLVIGSVLVLYNLAQIGPFQWQRQRATQALSQHLQQPEHMQNLASALSEPEFKPDIYYIVFDRYARQDILSEYFQIDTQDFIENLENQGFSVAQESYANYPNTFLSLSSSLNLRHLDFLSETLGSSTQDRLPVYSQLIQNNAAAITLQNLGYEYVLVGDFWDPSKTSPLATRTHNLFEQFDEYQLYVYERTLANALRGVLENKQLYTGVARLENISLNLEHRLSAMEMYAKDDVPQFVFAHFLLPHEPVVFDRTCRAMSFEELRALSTVEGYAEQVGCANAVMSRLAASLQANPDRPALVIFQSDEGPYLPEEYFNLGGEQLPDNPTSHKIHTAILHAVYFPGVTDYESLGFTDQSSPVNTFRVVLNTYFGAELELLENTSYVFERPESPYQFKKITLE